MTISPIPTGGNVCAWRVDGLVEKEDAAALREEMQTAVDSCADELSSNPLYAAALYETAHPDEAAYFNSAVMSIFTDLRVMRALLPVSFHKRLMSFFH